MACNAVLTASTDATHICTTSRTTRCVRLHALDGGELPGTACVAIDASVNRFNAMGTRRLLASETSPFSGKKSITTGMGARLHKLRVARYRVAVVETLLQGASPPLQLYDNPTLRRPLHTLPLPHAFRVRDQCLQGVNLIDGQHVSFAAGNARQDVGLEKCRRSVSLVWAVHK